MQNLSTKVGIFFLTCKLFNIYFLCCNVLFVLQLEDVSYISKI